MYTETLRPTQNYQGSGIGYSVGLTFWETSTSCAQPWSYGYFISISNGMGGPHNTGELYLCLIE